MPATKSPSTKVTLDQALATHRGWKARLQKAVQTGESLDVDAIRRDDCCELGQWLHSDGKILYGHAPQFSALLNKHSNFHLVTSIAAAVINGKDYAQAKTLIQTGSQFEAASTEVALAIMNLKIAVAPPH